MIQRHLAKELVISFSRYPVIVLTGPRQAGKSTLVKSLFSSKPYANLEGLSEREFASTDPRGFLTQFKAGAVLDEIQRVPQLLSEIQKMVDESGKNSLFVLTGSENLLLSHAVNQTLAGRVSIHRLFPLCLAEIKNEQRGSLDEELFRGGLPRIVAQNLPPREALDNYISTYLERDVRQVTGVENLALFQRFLSLCAGRVGQLINKESLASDAGISPTTVERWLSILEATYVCMRIQPWFKNSSKRLVKSPKLYFIDTGIVCALLGIRSPQDVFSHPLRGAIFENLQMIEVIKTIANRGERMPVYFYRDHRGNEVDILLEYNGGLLPIEVKASQTFSDAFLKGIRSMAAHGHKLHSPPVVVMGAESEQRRTEVTILPWFLLGNELVARYVVR